MEIPIKLTALTSILLNLAVTPIALTREASRGGLNLVTVAEGSVKLKRNGRPHYQQAKTGDVISAYDWVKLGPGAKAVILCDNITEWNVPIGQAFQVYKGCSLARPPILKCPSGSNGTTRGGNDPSIPYIISPRNTSLLTGRPTLQWNPVEGATRYQVQVRGPGVNWKTEVSQPEVVYAGAEPFTPGLRYRVVVIANNGASSTSELPTGFSILSAQDAQRVKSELEQLEQTQLQGDSQILAQAHLYRSNKLNRSAVEVLKQAIQSGSTTPAVHQLLGELYQQVGLNRLAEEPYLKATELAKADEALEGQAIAQANLGQVYEVVGELRKAIAALQTAQTHYRALGDEVRVQELQEQIDELWPRIEE